MIFGCLHYKIFYYIDKEVSVGGQKKSFASLYQICFGVFAGAILLNFEVIHLHCLLAI